MHATMLQTALKNNKLDSLPKSIKRERRPITLRKDRREEQEERKRRKK
jgi:hypothetical protein